MLEVSEDAVRVVDLSSTNGTFIDGEELQAGVAYALDENGEVVFGDEFLACYQLVKE
jgi:pSer/pThr/pTyr-binding forkhead associated (FHA) protein